MKRALTNLEFAIIYCMAISFSIVVNLHYNPADHPSLDISFICFLRIVDQGNYVRVLLH
jgi:hypothetical protein